MKEDVLHIVRQVVKGHYNDSDTGRMEDMTEKILLLFNGGLEGYGRCDTYYHNLEHTLQVLDPYAGIIDGYNRMGRTPQIGYKYFELGIIAVLLHDTGYIKECGDDSGTGGKYTFTHIDRSISFAKSFLANNCFSPQDIVSVSNMIQCTGLIERFSNISFTSEEERICGYALGTADLVGQMSAHDYPEKLMGLYKEFKEGYDHDGIDKLRERGVMVFESAEDLLKKTNGFYEFVVKKRFKEMGSLDECLKYHFPDNRNRYQEAIEKNLEDIRRWVEGKE